MTVTGRGRYSRDGTGLHRFVDADDAAYLHTKFAPYDAHRVYACFDQPDIKARLRLAVRVPEGWRVVANAPTSKSDDGWWRGEPTPPLPPYLTAFVAGPFAGIERSCGDVVLGLYARESRMDALRADADELLDLTAAGLAWYARQFGRPYPFGSRYDQVFAPEYSFGGMEHPGCVTLTERMLFDGTVTSERRRRRMELMLHEMAHMWFGNLVTMRWWDDLWLSEAFASLLAAMALEQTTAVGSDIWQLWCHDSAVQAREADQLPTTHPISARVPDTAAVRQQFDAITYRKGAAVLLQLMDEMGAEAFLAGARQYLNDHQWGNADREQFLASLSRTGLPNPAAWSADWLERAGLTQVAVVDGEASQDGEDGQAAAWLRLSPVESAVSMPTAGQTIDAAWYQEGSASGGELVEAGRQRARLALPRYTVRLEPLSQPKPIAGRRLIVPNAAARAYVKVVLDPLSTEVALDRLGSLADPLARAVCWTALWDAVSDGRLAPARFVEAAIRHVDAERVVGVVEQLLDRALLAATALSSDPTDGQAVRALAAAARARLDAAALEPDLEPVYVRLLARTAREEGELSFLQELLTDRAGRSLDPELRWQLIISLAAAGRLGIDEIEAERSRDPSGPGRQQAWAARAALPDPRSKARALAWIASPAGSLAERRAAMEGWQQPHQRDLLTDFAAGYPELAATVWSQGEEVGIAFARTMFPFHTADDATALALTAPLDRDGDSTPHGLRRVIREQRARLTRWQAARLLDASHPHRSDEDRGLTLAG